MATLISVAYFVPRLSLCVAHFDAIPESASSSKAPQFKDCGAFPVKMWRVSLNCGALAKIAACRKSAVIRSRADPEANHKSAAHFLPKSGAQIFF